MPMHVKIELKNEFVENVWTANLTLYIAELLLCSYSKHVYLLT